MKSNRNMKLSAVLILGAASPAMAGPAPIDELRLRLATSQRQLADVEATIRNLEEQIAAQSAILADLERRMSAGNTDFDVFERYDLARARLAELHRELQVMQLKKQRLLSYIEWLKAQIAAWEAMGNRGGG